MTDGIVNYMLEEEKRMIENIPGIMLFYTNTKGEVISWNSGATRLTGYTDTEVTGESLAEFIAIPGTIAKSVTEYFPNGAMQQFESWMTSKEGKKNWVKVTLNAVLDAATLQNKWAVLIQDISAQKKAEEKLVVYKKQLKASQQKGETELADYKQALDESSIVAITDQKGKIKYVNENFCAISKYTKEELIGKDHRIINSDYHSKDFIRNLWVTIANGKIWRGEIRNVTKDGSFYWVDTTIVPFMNEKGKPYQYLAIRNDITLRKAAEEQLTKINESLEKKIRERTFELTEALEREKQLNELKSTFVSVASHEFKTPLSTIRSSIDLLNHYKSGEHAEKQTKHIERIRSSVTNLTDILSDFLSLDKLEQGLLEARYTEFNFEDLVKDVIEELDGLYKRKKQTVSYKIESPLPVKQDSKILRNVLLNLLSNAIKYSAEKKQITILVNADEKGVNVAVKDEGYGIPAEVQKDIFSKFFRAGNVTNIQGTGLGLNIVKKYMELLNGSIHFTSQLDRGSEFVIMFPRYQN